MFPLSLAAERNKEPILQVLRETILPEDRKVLEVGAGTGQHGLYFSQAFTGLDWVMSDRRENHETIRAVTGEKAPSNLIGPIDYEVGSDPFPPGRFDIVYTANTFHIMSWKLVKTFIKSLGKASRPGDRFIVYGPFLYDDVPTAPSNLAFDRSLKERDPASGIRRFSDVASALEARDFGLVKDYAMPANNRALVFIKV